MTTIDLAGRELQGGKYQLIDLVAQGGMASVWSAQMRSLDTVVAVKVLAPALAQSEAFRDQFQAEAHRVADLHHPNIIDVHDCEAEGDVMYIAMRYVPGGSLSEYLKRLDGPMDLQLAAKLTSQLASALQAAHDHGLGTVVYVVFAAVAVGLLYRVWRHAGAAGLGAPSAPLQEVQGVSVDLAPA